ncbi:MAG: DNA polymerase III subunit beta [Alphaproteobacteria bacterium]|nr:DNA polymerase III subunit beta [Alphaproteobacteria bacterium]
MKFIVSSGQLNKSLHMLNGIIVSHSVLPVLENFLFVVNNKILTIVATDLESTIQVKLDVESENEGSICIRAKQLVEYLSKVPDQPLIFSVDENFQIQVSTNNGNYKFMGENSGNYPKDVSKEEENAITCNVKVPSKYLAEAISYTQSSLSNDSNRPAMCGLLFEVKNQGLNFVSTDAHRLSFYRNDNVIFEGEDSKFIISKKPLQSLKSIVNTIDEDIELDFSSKFAFIRAQHFTLSTRLIEAKFPDYTIVIPREFNFTLTINKNELLNALKRVIVFSSKSNNLVRLNARSNSLVVDTEDSEFNNAGQENLNCQFSGDELTIGFNGKNLIENLTAFSSENIQFEIISPMKAVVIKPVEQNEHENYFLLVIPLAIA